MLNLTESKNVQYRLLRVHRSFVVKNYCLNRTLQRVSVLQAHNTANNHVLLR